MKNFYKILITLSFVGATLFGEQIQINSKNGNNYTGSIKSYNNTAIHLLTDTSTMNLVILEYGAIETVIYKNDTLVAPVDRSVIERIIENKTSPVSIIHNDFNTIYNYDSSFARSISPCYDDVILFNKIRNIENLSESAFQNIMY